MGDPEEERKEHTWENIAGAMKNFGWFTQTMSENKIIFERGRQRIEVRKLPAVDKWKVEYFSGSIMDDTTGLEDEFLAKRDTVEMGIGK